MTCREADGEVSSSSPVCIMFGKEEVPATRLQRGVYRCHAPPHEAGMVSLSITWGDGSPCSNAQPFTYRVTPQTARAQVWDPPAPNHTDCTAMLTRLLCLCMVHPQLRSPFHHHTFHMFKWRNNAASSGTF